MEANSVLISGLPAEGVTESAVAQYMSFCGPVNGVLLFPPATPAAASSSSASPAFSTALVIFAQPSSVGYAELVSGCLYDGRVIDIRSATAAAQEAEREATAAPLASEPVHHDAAPAHDGVSSLPGQQQQQQHGGVQGEEEEAEDIPETMTGLWVRARMQRAAKSMRLHTAHLLIGARENVAKVRQGALALELKAAHMVSDVREMRETVPVYGNGPTREQYNYTATQPQWGRQPAWLRQPRAP